MTPQSDPICWRLLGATYDLSDLVALLPHGGVSDNGERREVRDGEQVDLQVGDNCVTVRFADGRWYARQGSHARSATSNGIPGTREEHVSARPRESSDAATHAQAAVSSWPEWKTSEIVTLAALAVFAFLGLIWLIV